MAARYLWVRDAQGWSARLEFDTDPQTWGDVLDKLDENQPPGRFAFITVQGKAVEREDAVDIPADTVPVYGYYQQTMVKPARASAQFDDDRATELSKALGMLGGKWEINEDIVHRAYVYLRQPGRQPTDDEERVAETALEIFDEIGALGNQAEEDDDSTLEEIEVLIRGNRSVLRREWKFHLQPTKNDLGKLVRKVTASQLIGERCGIIKVLYDNTKLRNRDASEGNFARVVVYFYGAQTQANDVLDELVRVTAGVTAIATVPRYSVRATPVVYWTQSSGDIKNNYSVMADWYERPPAADLFEADFTSFRGRGNRLQTTITAQARAALPRSSVRMTRGQRAQMQQRLSAMYEEMGVTFQSAGNAQWSFRFERVTPEGSIEAVGEFGDVSGERLVLQPTANVEVFISDNRYYGGDYYMVKEIGDANVNPFGTAEQISGKGTIADQRDALMAIQPGQQLNWGPFMFKFYNFRQQDDLAVRETYLRFMSSREVCEGTDPRTGECYNIYPEYYRRSISAAEVMLTITRLNEVTGNEEYEAFLMADTRGTALHFSLLCNRSPIQYKGRSLSTSFALMLQCMMANYAFAIGYQSVVLEALEDNKTYYLRFGYSPLKTDAQGEPVADDDGNITFVLRKDDVVDLQTLCEAATTRVGRFLQEYESLRGAGASGMFTDEEIASRLRQGASREQVARLLLSVT